LLFSSVQFWCAVNEPGCSPPGYPPRRRLLIIVDWSVNWFARVQRRTYTSYRILSHASVREMSEGENSKRENVRSQGVSVRSRCIDAVNRNRRRRPRVLLVLTTVERVVDERTKFITHWSL